jgi:hypothetical protein
MVGISGDCLVWISHILFAISRNQPKLNLRKLFIKNEHAKRGGMVIEGKRVSFTKGLNTKVFTVFIDHELREGVMKLYIFFFYFLFMPFNVFFLSVGRFFVISLAKRYHIPLMV